MQKQAEIRIRRVTSEDLRQVAQMAAALVRLHYGWDSKRFFLVDNVEDGYFRYFSSQLHNEDCVLLVAERLFEGRSEIVGYLYGCLEPRDWNALLDACAWIHDVYVNEEARRSGCAVLLLEDAKKIFASKGAPRVVLQTSTSNVAAQKLFQANGFRATMIEMTCELT